MQRIAVIGSGIAGLSAAWLLSTRYAVTLFEAAATLGGHTNTIDVVVDGKTFAVDTGFLEQAQIRKYKRILEVLDVGPEQRILEIGCGWGGFAEHAVSTRGCRVHGITLSTEQLAFARERLQQAGLGDRATFELRDYRDVSGEYDFIVSIEMFEAVGERYWPRYFRSVRDRLRRGGRALIQTIVIADELFERYRTGTDFIQQYVFPGGMLPSPRVFRERAFQQGLTPGEGFAFRYDYAETLKRWRHTFNNRVTELAGLGFDERFIRLWYFYLIHKVTGL